MARTGRQRTCEVSRAGGGVLLTEHRRQLPVSLNLSTSPCAHVRKALLKSEGGNTEKRNHHQSSQLARNRSVFPPAGLEYLRIHGHKVEY